MVFYFLHSFGLILVGTVPRSKCLQISGILKWQLKLHSSFSLQYHFYWYFNSFAPQSLERKSISIINFFPCFDFEIYRVTIEWAASSNKLVEFSFCAENFFFFTFIVPWDLSANSSSPFVEGGWADFSSFSVHLTDLIINVFCTEVSAQLFGDREANNFDIFCALCAAFRKCTLLLPLPC